MPFHSHHSPNLRPRESIAGTIFLSHGDDGMEFCGSSGNRVSRLREYGCYSFVLNSKCFFLRVLDAAVPHPLVQFVPSRYRLPLGQKRLRTYLCTDLFRPITFRPITEPAVDLLYCERRDHAILAGRSNVNTGKPDSRNQCCFPVTAAPRKLASKCAGVQAGVQTPACLRATTKCNYRVECCAVPEGWGGDPNSYPVL